MALFPSKPTVQEIFISRDPLEITLTSFGGSGTSIGKIKTETETRRNKKLEMSLMIAKLREFFSPLKGQEQVIGSRSNRDLIDERVERVFSDVFKDIDTDEVKRYDFKYLLIALSIFF